MNYKGEIVLASYPFDDFSDVKARPILCLTDPIGENFHVVGTCITTQTNFEAQLFDIPFQPGQEAWQTTGLKTDSVLRLHRLTTFDVSIARRSLGEWAAEQRLEVESRLHNYSAYDHHSRLFRQ